MFNLRHIFDTFYRYFLFRKHEKLYDKKTLFKNWISFRIIFVSMSYMKYVESPTMGFFDLISNLGGTLGLFLGKHLYNFISN